MIREISGTINIRGPLLDWYKRFIDCLFEFVRRILGTVEAPFINDTDSMKREFRDLVGQGNSISASTTVSSTYQRIRSRAGRITGEQFQTSANMPAPDQRCNILQMTETVTHPQLKNVLVQLLNKMKQDEERFGVNPNSFNTNLPGHTATPKLVPGIIIATVRPVAALIEMINEPSNQIVNFWGPSWCGTTHIVQELLEDPKLRDIYGDNIYHMDVQETPNKEMFISMVLGLLNCKGKGDGVGIMIRFDGPKLLILDNFPPEWERSIEELAFPSAGCKLLVVSMTKLSSFNAYGLDNVCDEDGQMFHLYSPILNENPFNFFDVKNEFMKDDKTHEGFKAPGVFRWKKECSCPKLMLDVVEST